MYKHLRRTGKISIALMLSFVLLLASPSVQALTPKAIQDINNFKPWYDRDDLCQTGDGISDVDAGGNNVETAYKFFVANGWTPDQSAGIVGNLMVESTDKIDPTITNSIGAHGIAQWLGSRLTAMRAWVRKQPPPNNDPETINGQLPFILHEFDTTHKAARNAVAAAKTYSEAADKFNKLYEISGTPSQPRIDRAKIVLDKYGGTVVEGIANTANQSCANPGSTGSPECQNPPAGTTTATPSPLQKIICEAIKYDPVSYFMGPQGNHLPGGSREWKEKFCPVISPKCYLDCSGLVSVAVYDAFGNNKTWVVSTLLTDTSNWKRISASELGPGDLVVPNPGHVEIVDHVKGTRIYHFGAHNSRYPQPKQVGPASYLKTTDNNTAYLRYVGKGV
jgi:hypothetical protein